MMRSRFRLDRFAQACGLALAVACVPTCSAPDDEVLVQITSAINPGGGCMTLPPDRLMTAPGQFVTDANYDHSTCPRGYLINFDRYPVNHNAIAAFAGPVPTNEADCTRSKITAYVWRRTATGVTFIGSAERSGTWAPDIRGVSHCAPAIMNIEQAVPAFRGNGSDNYRIGLQARINDASGTGASI